jgi:hypothetical protein
MTCCKQLHTAHLDSKRDRPADVEAACCLTMQQAMLQQADSSMDSSCCCYC